MTSRSLQSYHIQTTHTLFSARVRVLCSRIRNPWVFCSPPRAGHTPRVDGFFVLENSVLVIKSRLCVLYLVTELSQNTERQTNKMQKKKHYNYSKEILTAMRVMVVSIGSRGSHIPAMTPRRLRRGVIAGM